jgi:hypothetical protein
MNQWPSGTAFNQAYRRSRWDRQGDFETGDGLFGERRPLPLARARLRLEHMKRTLLILLAGASLAACTTTSGPSGGPPPPPPPPESGPPPSANVFRTQDFAWSTVPGRASLNGTMAYRAGATRYSCQGGDVKLTPETPWSRRRMTILYGSPTYAAVPVDTVRARTPSAPTGDYANFVRTATCDAQNHFTFTGLPDGAWFVITLAKPVGTDGAPVAVMRRVETRGGPRAVLLN